MNPIEDPPKDTHTAHLTRPASRCTRDLSDTEALQYSDEEILAAAQAKWTSDIYSHYKTRIKRPQPDGPQLIELQFECRFNEPKHSTYCRHWKARINGSLWSAASRCNTRRQAGAAKPNTKATYPEEIQESAPWELKRLAWMCIQSSLHRVPPWPTDTSSTTLRLFNENVDENSPPSSVVAQSLNHICLPLSIVASRYFQRMSGAVHLIIDGWTNRTPADSLVCVVVAWQEDGRAFRSILDVAWVSDLSPESYVTNFISGCLERYGLIRKIKTICLRNAPHSEQVCAGLHAKHSSPYLQTRTLCYSHVVGLMMEAFTSFLRPLPRVTPVKYFQDAGVEDDTEMDDLELDYSLSEREYNADLVQEAVRNARRELDIDIERKVLQGAPNVLSKVTALEQVIGQVNSQALKQAYWGRSQQESVSETHRSVVRPRGSRKWGTIRDSMMRCSEFIPTFRNLVAAGVNVPGIEECFLDEIEQNILDEFHTGFEVFDDVVSVLSLQETPFLHEVVVELFNLRMRLEDIRNGSRLGTSPTSVTRVAAEAALWAYKLMVKDDELPDICIIAVVMHPTHKLQWFNKRGMDTRRIEAAVIERFNQSYPLVLVKGESNQDGLVESKNAVATDNMGNYLDRPTLSKEVIEEKGGLLNYWNQELVTQPRVAQMALDYLTIPATSVDLTRIFSGGQMATNGLEKHVNYDTFRAMMSMGSWFGTPVLPEIDAVANLLEM